MRQDAMPDRLVCCECGASYPMVRTLWERHGVGFRCMRCWSPQEREVADRERAVSAQRALLARRRDAWRERVLGFDAAGGLADATITRVPEATRDVLDFQMDRFVSGIGSGHGMCGAILFGPNGTGKTYSAIACVNEVLRRVPQARPVIVREASLAIGPDGSGLPPWEVAAAAARVFEVADIVVIDEVGRLMPKAPEWRLGVWDALLASAREKPRSLMLLITTNLPAARRRGDTADPSAFDAHIGSAAESRLAELDREFVTGEDRRLEAARQVL